MAKPLGIISSFRSGVVPDQTVQSGFSALHCLDMHSRPGVLRVMRKLDADSDSAVVDLIRWMDIYEPSGGSQELYGYGSGGRIYRRTSGSWALLRTVAASDGQGFAKFGSSLYYTRRGFLGKLTGDPTVGGNYNDSFQTLKETVDSDELCPLQPFFGALFGGNGRYVFRMDPDEASFDDEVLTLPVGHRIYCMAEWDNYLVIGTRSGTDLMEESIFLWDGISEFWNQKITVPKPGPSAVFNFNHTLYAFIVGALYKYTGSEFEVEENLPGYTDGVDIDNLEVRPGAVHQWKELMLFGASKGSGTFGKFKHGVWSLGRHSTEFMRALNFLLEPTNGNGSAQCVVGAVKSFGTSDGQPVLYVSWEDNQAGTYGVDVISSNRRFENEAYLISKVLEIGGDDPKLIRGVRIQSPEDIVGSFTVKYRTDADCDPEDEDANWTTLGTIDSTNQNELLNGIYERVADIQFRIDFTSSTSTTGGPSMTRLEIY